MLLSGANVIIWSLCHHLLMFHRELMLSSWADVIIWDEMFSSGMKCYHLGLNNIIWDEMLSSGANVII